MEGAFIKRASALAMLAGIAVLTGCDQGEESANSMPEQPRVTMPVSAVEPPLDRANLLLAVGQAVSAASLGQDDRDQQHMLDGKPFQVRIRFGCSSSSVQGARGTFEVIYEQDDRVLRVRAAPTLTLEDPVIAAILSVPEARTDAEPAIEAVEGFWLNRPWILSDGCPASTPPRGAEDSGPDQGKIEVEPGPGTTTAPNQRIGIAHIFTETDARTGRRAGRAYEVTKVLGADEQPSAQGYNLVLSGRLQPRLDRKVITCRASLPDRAPDCIVSVQFDRVQIEAADTVSVLGEWSI